MGATQKESWRPLSSATGAADETAMCPASCSSVAQIRRGRVPSFFRKRQRPRRLRFRANQRDGTEAFKFAARAGDEKS